MRRFLLAVLFLAACADISCRGDFTSTCYASPRACVVHPLAFADTPNSVYDWETMEFYGWVVNVYDHEELGAGATLRRVLASFQSCSYAEVVRLGKEAAAAYRNGTR